MGQRDHLRLRPDERLELVAAQPALVVDVDVAQDGAALLGDELPGDHVAVVLDDADDDLVAGLEEAPSPGVRDEVDPLGRVAREDDALGAVGRLDEARDLGARAFVGLGRLFGERVQAAVDVGVVVLVVVDERVDDLARLLGRRGVVQVDQRAAVHLALEDGEVLADRFYVKHVSP